MTLVCSSPKGKVISININAIVTKQTISFSSNIPLYIHVEKIDA